MIQLLINDFTINPSVIEVEGFMVQVRLDNSYSALFGSWWYLGDIRVCCLFQVGKLRE